MLLSQEDPHAARRAALHARLKCEVVKIAEEAARERGCRVSPQVAQCLCELTMTCAVKPSKYCHIILVGCRSTQVTRVPMRVRVHVVAGNLRLSLVKSGS